MKAAVMIMAVTGITAVPAMPALAEAGGSGGFPEKWEEVSVGASLKDIYTDKSMYSPGEPVTVTVEMNSHKVTGEETLRLQIRHLDTVVWEQERQLSPGSSAGHFVASLPGEDFQGYAAEAYLWAGRVFWTTG